MNEPSSPVDDDPPPDESAADGKVDFGPAPAFERLMKLIHSQVRPGQFRMTRMFWLMLGVAVLFGLPRVMRVSYTFYFGLMYGLAFLFGPVVALLAAALWPWHNRRQRVAVFATTLVLLAGPPVVVSLGFGGPQDLIVLGLFLTFVWGPQLVGIFIGDRRARAERDARTRALPARLTIPPEVDESPAAAGDAEGPGRG